MRCEMVLNGSVVEVYRPGSAVPFVSFNAYLTDAELLEHVARFMRSGKQRQEVCEFPQKTKRTRKRSK